MLATRASLVQEQCCVSCFGLITLARQDRLAALAAIATLLMFILFKVPFIVRGFELGMQLLILVLVLAYMRPHLETPRSCATKR